MISNQGNKWIEKFLASLSKTPGGGKLMRLSPLRSTPHPSVLLEKLLLNSLPSRQQIINYNIFNLDTGYLMNAIKIKEKGKS